MRKVATNERIYMIKAMIKRVRRNKVSQETKNRRMIFSFLDMKIKKEYIYTYTYTRKSSIENSVTRFSSRSEFYFFANFDRNKIVPREKSWVLGITPRL